MKAAWWVMAVLPWLVAAAGTSEAAGRWGFEQRLDCALALEEVRWSHRAWPKSDPAARPPRDQLISDAVLAERVRSSLTRETELTEQYGFRIEPAALEQEVERMLRHSRAPARLTELLSALDDQTRAIEECLARPALVEREWLRQTQNTRVEPAAGPALHEPLIDGLALATSEPRAGVLGNDGWRVEDYPDARFGHSALWTGSELLLWGGTANGSAIDTGSRYDPATDSWAGISTRGAPSARAHHAAVWTGGEMIIWGGSRTQSSFVEDGGRYDPLSDTWRPINTTNAPLGRSHAGTVWTGTEMIVWGGQRPAFTARGDGGRYNPASDEWTTLPDGLAPAARYNPGAVWTGGEMLIWGGQSAGSSYLAGGARYNPTSNQWQPLTTTGQPSARSGHTVVWTGEELIAWGGRDADNNTLQSGGRYDPALDQWSPIAESGSPGARIDHQAVWTGSEMLIWGGNWPSYPNLGGRYDPQTNSWAPMSTSGAPIGRSAHSLTWTGSEAVVFGGSRGSSSARNDGGRYDPATDSWNPINDAGTPPHRSNHVAVWTGNEKIIWGGDGSNGARYDPATDSWAATSLLNAPAGRIRQSAIWTGTEMIIWGGIASSVVRNTGARYNPDLDHWEPTSLVDAPAPRQWHSAVWDGARMLIWGGLGSDYLNDGAAYDPVDNSWTPLPELGAPAPRVEHSAEWTGSEMIIWGGRQSLSTRLNDGARLDPASGIWTPMSEIDVPDGRYKHSSVWTGSELLVWAGNGGGRTGGLYDPVSDSWRATTLDNAPSFRQSGHASIWTGQELVIWSGWSTLLTQTGGRYDPASDSWQAISLVGAPAQRDGHSAVWTGEGMLVWGGHANAPGLWYPDRPLAPPQIRIVAQTPAPSVVGQAVEVMVEIIDPAGPPEDGQVRILADDGSQCLDAGPPLTEDGRARFACSLVFPAPGQHWLIAEFSDSASHPDLDSADSPREHRVFADQGFQLGGNLTGLLGQGLMLTLNQAETIEPTEDGPWQFATTLADGSSYAVTVSSQPANPVQTCAVAGHAGRVEGADVNHIEIICQTEAFTIGGEVSGLAGTGLVLVLNQVQTLPISEDGSFVFPDPLPDTSSWQVGVQTQPGGPAQTCTISNGEGQLAGAPVVDVLIDCQTNLYTIGGLVSGLQGAGLVLQNNGGDDRAIGGNGSFSFATALPEGSPYMITVSNQPTQPLQNCTLGNASGTVGTANVNNILVECQSEEFIVIAQAGPGGSIDPSGPQYVEQGAQPAFLITPEPGWGLAVVDGSCGGSLDGLSFTTDPVTADCSVQASFLPPAGIALASAANPATWNEPVEMTVTVSGDTDPPADGMVTIEADSGESCFSPAADLQIDNQAIYRCSMSFATTGSRQLIAHFEGSSSHADGQSEPLEQDVRRNSLTEVNGMQPEAGQYVGQAYWVEVSVYGEDPTGTITVSDDLNSQCQFSLEDQEQGCELVSTQAGIRTITAHYPGDPDHFASQGSRQYLLAGPEPVSLVFETEPTNGLVDQPLNPGPRIHALDALGNLATSAEPFIVTLSLSGGHPEAKLTGTLQQSVSEGVAEFPNLTIDRPGDDYRLHASDDQQALEPAESEPFRIQRDGLFADRFEAGG